mgnify:CR=1 FL=1
MKQNYLKNKQKENCKEVFHIENPQYILIHQTINYSPDFRNNIVSIPTIFLFVNLNLDDLTLLFDFRAFTR